MVKVRAVIFDVDGTLIDSVDQHAQAWVRGFADFGVEAPFAKVRHEIGKGADQLMPDFLDPATLERIGEQVEARQGEIFKRDYLETLEPFADVPALFKRLRAEGLKCVLATSAKAEEAKRKAEIAGITDLVDAVTTADDAEHSKPCPDIFLAALGRIAPITAAEAVVIGDTPYDAEAAVGAGMRFIGVLSGGFPEAELRAPRRGEIGCIAIYRDVADLLARLDDSPILR